MGEEEVDALPYEGRALNVAKGLNSAYEGLLKIPRFIYGLAAVPQNALASVLDMPSLEANYDDFLKTTNTGLMPQSPLTMLDQLGDYYGAQSEDYGTRTRRYDDNITSSIGKGKWSEAGSQILDQIAESAPSIAVMAMTSGAGEAGKLGEVSKALANALPFMSQKNAEIQDDKSIPEWKKPVVSAFNGFAEVMLDTKYGTQAAINGLVDVFQREGREVAVDAGKKMIKSYMEKALDGSKVLKPFIEGYLEEASTQLAQNALDKFALGKDIDLMDGVNDAGLVGSAMTGSISSLSKVADNIVQPKAKAQVNELQSQQESLLNELANPNLSEEAKKGVEGLIKDNQTSIESIAKETADAIAKLNPSQKKQVEGLSEKIVTAENLVNDPNTSEEVKKVAQKNIGQLGKEIDAIKPEESVSAKNSQPAKSETTPITKGSDVTVDDEVELVNGRTGKVTKVEGNQVTMKMENGATFMATPDMVEMSKIKPLETVQETITPKPVQSTEEAKEAPVESKNTVSINGKEYLVGKDYVTDVETGNLVPLRSEIADKAIELAKETPKEVINEVKQEPTKESIPAEDVSSKRNEEVLTKAEDDLKALKQVTNKVAKYTASVKRLNEAFRAGEISEKEFNDTKQRFDDVIADSSPNMPKAERLTSEETKQLDNELKNENLTTNDFIQYERARAIQEATDVTEAIQQPSNDTGGSGQEASRSETAQREGAKDRESLTPEEATRKKELRNKFAGRFNDVTNIIATLADKEFREYAGLILKEAKGDFKNFSKDMIESVGEKIREHLPKLYAELNGTDNQDVESDIKEIGLTKVEVANLRAELGKEQFEYEVKGNAERIREAKQLIKEGYNIKDLVNKLKSETYLPSALEVEVLKQYYSGLTNEINKNPTPENLKKRDDLLKTIDVVKVSQGRSIQAWDGLTQLEDNLANFLTEESKYTILSAEEIASLTDKYAKAKEALEKYQKKQQESLNRAKNKKAQEEINKQKTNPNRAAVKEAYKEERKQFVEDFRAELKKIRTTQSAVILPYQRELIALAPFVRKMVASYASEGIYDLKEIVKGIHAEFKEDVPELTEDDVRDIIAGEHRNPKKTKNAKLAQIRDLQRQAKLERQIELLNEGILEVKNPIEKRRKSDKIEQLENEIKEIKKRNPELFSQQAIAQAEETAKKNIADLEKKISDDDLSFKEIVRPTSEQLNEFRKRQKELRSELEARRKEEEVGRYSPEAKLDTKKKWFNTKIEQLKKEISEGNFEPIEEPIPILLDDEALKLKDEYMAFKEETRLRRDHAQYEASSKYDKAIDGLQQLAGIRRLVQTSLDLSIPFRQGIAIMLNTGIPLVNKGTMGIGANAYTKMAENVFSDKNYQRMMFDLKETPEFLQSKDDGIVYAEIGTTNNENRDEFHRDNFLYRIPYLNAPLIASERAAASWSNYARYQLYLRGVKMLQAQGKTRANAKEAYEQMALRVMVDTGRGKIPLVSDKASSREGAALKQVLGNTLYGARLASGIFRKLNPLYYLNPKVDASVRVQELKDMIGYTAGLVIVGLAFSATGYTVSFDQDDPDFLKARKGKKVIDFSGGQATYVRTFLRILKAAYMQADPDVSHEDAKKYSSFMAKSVGNFWRNKLAPNTSYAVNAIMGENAIGEKFDPYEIIKIWPMYSSDVYNAVKEGSYIDLLTIIPTSISGLGYMEYEKDVRKANLNVHLDKTKDKKVISFLKEHQLNLSSDINQEIYNVETGEKTRMTREQSDKYEKLWSEYIIDELKDVGVISELNKLDDKKLKKEINAVKLAASKYAKQKITGISETSVTIRDDEKNYELTPAQVKQRIKLNKEFLSDNGADLRSDLLDKFINDEGMSKDRANRRADVELEKRANRYSRAVMLDEEKEKNDGKITWREKE